MKFVFMPFEVANVIEAIVYYRYSHSKRQLLDTD